MSADEASPTPGLQVKLTPIGPAPSPEDLGKLTVEVLFSDNKQPVPNAVVSISPPAAPPAVSVGKTDPGGHAHFDGVPVGNCTVTALLGKVSGSATVQISTDLQTWNSGPGYVIRTDDASTDQATFRSVSAIGDMPQQYFRLLVTQS